MQFSLENHIVRVVILFKNESNINFNKKKRNKSLIINLISIGIIRYFQSFFFNKNIFQIISNMLYYKKKLKITYKFVRISFYEQNLIRELCSRPERTHRHISYGRETLYRNLFFVTTAIMTLSIHVLIIFSFVIFYVCFFLAQKGFFVRFERRCCNGRVRFALIVRARDAN